MRINNLETKQVSSVFLSALRDTLDSLADTEAMGYLVLHYNPTSLYNLKEEEPALHRDLLPFISSYCDLRGFTKIYEEWKGGL